MSPDLQRLAFEKPLAFSAARTPGRVYANRSSKQSGKKMGSKKDWNWFPHILPNIFLPTRNCGGIREHGNTRLSMSKSRSRRTETKLGLFSDCCRRSDMTGNGTTLCQRVLHFGTNGPGGNGGRVTPDHAGTLIPPGFQAHATGFGTADAGIGGGNASNPKTQTQPTQNHETHPIHSLQPQRQ